MKKRNFIKILFSIFMVPNLLYAKNKIIKKKYTKDYWILSKFDK